MLRSRSKDRFEKMPGPSYMSAQQMADYLHNLRSNRVQRPTGARPPPASFVSSRNISKAGPDTEATDAEPSEKPTIPFRCSSAQSHHRSLSSASNNSNLDQSAGRPLARPPRPRMERDFSGSSLSSNASGSIPYRENGTRWMERMEAHSIRLALEQHDMEEEQKLFDAAQGEAAELVWKHQNPNAAYRNPDAPCKYNDPLRKTSHGRSQSWSRVQEAQKGEPNSNHQRHSISHTSGLSRSRNSSGHSSRVPSDGSVKLPDVNEDAKEEEFDQITQHEKDKNPSALKISAVPSSVFPDPKSRRKSSGSRRKGSGSLFANPEDKIYEEPEGAKAEPTPKLPSDLIPLAVRRNPFARVKFAAEALPRAQTDPILGTKKLDRYEIHKNPPTQSRNPGYMSNPAPNTQPQVIPSSGSENENDPTRLKDGKEIRGEDIRAATSMKLKDRSAKLPTPTMVSDSPGRPIVSFQQDWKPKEVELKVERSAPLPQSGSPSTPPPRISPYPMKPAASVPSPEIHAAEAPRSGRAQQPQPPIPVICVPDEPSSAPTPSITIGDPKPPIPFISVSGDPSPPIPSISVNDAASAARDPMPSISVNAAMVPTINVSDSGSAARPSARPLPAPGKVKAAVEAFSKSSHTNGNARSHWTPSVRHTGALCSNCALPISGRIVGAAGSRFHPDCFTCYHCHERLECVAFYPEPESKREERIARIRARINGEDVPIPAGMSAAEAANLEAADGDESMRFYCHLDYHEFFSPRCKSCKTPIEGEVVVACGAEWHVGHFFCAQCGDPFDAQTPFVEKDGYAWCVNCHTNRYSTKCRRCRKPVTDVVVKALGSEWHEECFVCTECDGQFKDGRYFLRGEDEDPVCVKCEERRLKA